MTVRQMTGTASLMLLVLMAWTDGPSDRLGARGAPQLPAQTPPSFRAAADLVTVDASVLVDGEAVTGLGASDFEILDNGVRQTIERVETTAMPLDVTLVVDTSRLTVGAFTNQLSTASMQRTVERDVRRIADLLRPEDRLSVVAASSYVVQMAPLAPPGPVDVKPLPTQGLPAAFDALVGAMLRPTEPGRRQMVVAWTKGVDHISLNTSTVVREVARRANAVVHVVARREWEPPASEMEFGAASAESSAVAIGGIERGHRAWQPFLRSEPRLLSDIAELTGGTLRGLGVFADRNAADTFKDIFDDHRKGYVIRYAPRNVAREGWHEIAIRTPRLASARIRARRGYFIEGAPAAARPPAGAAGDSSRSNAMLAALTRAMDTSERGDAGPVRTMFRQTADLEAVIRSYRAMDHRWPGLPMRSTLFALELGAAGLDRPGEVQRAALQMLTDYEVLVRHPLEPDEFECAWYDAEATVIVASMQTEASLATIKRGLERCPDHSGLLLSRALATDQVWSTSIGRGRASPATRSAVSSADAVAALYAEAARHADVASEADMRRAWLFARAGRRDEALALLDGLVPPTHPVGRYYAAMIRAQILRDEGQLDAAAKSFEAALTHWPRAQSAGVGLLTTWLGLGRRQEAEALAEIIQSESSPSGDPWWGYWQGRFIYAFPDMMARLAKVVRP